MTTYVMEAKENYDSTRISAINALTTWNSYIMCTDQNHQGIQWDPVRRNLMYMYMEWTPASPSTNTTGFTLWDGTNAIAPGGAVDSSRQWNSSVALKNIDTDAVTIYNNYNVANLVPAGIGGGDGTWRRFTTDFSAYQPQLLQNGPGMTDPYTGNFWINSESCQLYCFRLTDNYSQTISPLKPQTMFSALVKPVGFTGGATVDSWTYAREINETALGTGKCEAYLYLTPREFTAEEITADELSIYATYTYPRTDYLNIFTACNREVFDKAGNMYVASCNSYGGKDFRLYKFTQPTSAPFGGPQVGGGFTDITPWGAATGPNADGTTYTEFRTMWNADQYPASGSLIPFYIPASDDLVIIEKFFPSEKTAASTDPALMFWSCTYVNDPAGTPTWDHHSSFVTGYMSSTWTPTDISGAAYAVYDAFEVNNYLDQSDYTYDYDAGTRWFFFQCVGMSGGVPDNKARIVLVEYRFTNGSAPTVLQVIDEQGWDDAYPAYADHTNNQYSTSNISITNTAAVATAMKTVFNYDVYTPLWDSGIYDPVTESFWWSGGGSDEAQLNPLFSLFDSTFYNRIRNTANADAPYAGETVPTSQLYFGATPPFLKLSFAGSLPPTTEERRKLTVWGFNQDGHKHYVFRLGTGMTLVYDRLTQQWAEWRTENDTVWRAHIGGNWLGIGADPLGTAAWNVIGGDDRTGILWYVDPTKSLDHDVNGNEVAFTRQIISMVPVRMREGQQCGGIYMLADLGDPAITGDAITLYTSDNDGRDYVNQGSVTVYADNNEQELAWIGLGLMTSPGRFFKFEDDGAVARISSLDVR